MDKVIEKDNRNNILFVGNGLDLLAGYNTDYPSFLKYYGNHYMKMQEKVIAKTLEINKIKNRNSESLDVSELLSCFFKESKKLELSKFIKNNQVIKLTKNQYSLRWEASNVYADDLYTMLETEMWDILNDMLNVDKEVLKVNTWLTYFQTVYAKNLLTENNWIDLESLILENIRNEENLAYSYTKHLMKLELKLTEKERFEDFLEMKKLLSQYLSNEKKNEKNEILVHHSIFLEYGRVINFNYSTNECFEVKNRYRNYDYISYTDTENPIETFIHGEVSNEDMIVFGYDDGITKDSISKKNLIKPAGKAYSKTRQLLTLSTYNSEYYNNMYLPMSDDILKIGVLGHGIGEADYNYFESLANFEKVIIEVFWYKFRDKLTGEITEGNNKQSLMDSITDMIHEMEARKGEVILHKMLIEQRIVFKEFEYVLNDEKHDIYRYDDPSEMVK